MMIDNDITKPILAIIPSYGRSHKVLPFIEAYKQNSSGLSDILFVLEDDDPQLEEYQRIMPDDVQMLVGHYGGWPAAVNAAYAANRGYDIYLALADDSLPRTSGFEERFIEALSDGVGIAYPNDLFQRENLPTHAAIHGTIGKALGYLINPNFKHLYVDNWWKELGRYLPVYRYLDDVIIEHMHPAAGKAPNDSVYQRLNSQESYKYGEGVLNALIKSGSVREDARKVREYVEQR